MNRPSDDGFSDLQLTRKQTVFLLVASMVVVSVAFISGVLVGRGVNGTMPPALYSEAAVSEASLPDDLPPPPPVQSGNTPSADGIVKETVTYPDRLTQTAPATERLSEIPAVRNEALPPDERADAVLPSGVPAAVPSGGQQSPDPAPARGSAAGRGPADSPTASAAAATSFGEPAGTGMAIQVSAFRNSREAETMAGRLVSKGYRAYVIAPAPGAPNLFRVRIGKFATRADADRVVTRLKREEKLDPWIVP
jgi:cell division septation protein DedD